MDDAYINERKVGLYGQKMFHTILKVRKLTYNRSKDNDVKLVRLLNQLTLSEALKTFNLQSPSMQRDRHESKNLSLKGQRNALHLMLSLAESTHVEIATVSCFYIYYFIVRMFRTFTLSFLTRMDRCIIAHPDFRDVSILKVAHLKSELRNTVIMLPHGFIEKLLRLLSDSNKLLCGFIEV